MAKTKIKTRAKADTGKTKQQLAEELAMLRCQIIEAEDKALLSEKIIAIAVDAIISIDENQRVIRFNRGAEHIFGYSKGEVIGQSLDILLPDQFKHDHHKYVTAFGESNRASRMMNERSDILALRKDGSEFPAKASIARVDHAGRRVLTVYLRDLSDIRLAEEAVRKSREELAHVSRVGMLGEISASIAHEVNQPLAAILTNAQVIRRQTHADSMESKDLIEAIEDVISDAQRAGEVIKRLKSLMRPGESNVGMFDLNQLIIQTLQLVRSEIIIKNVSVSMKLTDGILNVFADKIQTQQILLNLITNAFDAMLECRLEDRNLTISTRSLEMHMAEVSVEDTGPGYDESLAHKLFEPFYSTKERGMGMGLAISKAILLAQGGRLWAQNNQNRGACFLFTLPTSPAATQINKSDQPEVMGPSGKDTEHPSTDATVFVVDDDDSFRTATLRLLDSAGYAVEGFQSGKQFLARDYYEGIGCLVVDLHMPQETGFDLQAKLNNREYSMPIIFITGAGDAASGVKAMKDGALDFLTKPVDELKLLAAVENAIELDRQARINFSQQVEANAKISKLTNRENQVMGLVIKGLRNKQIAFTLGISEKTVKVHRGHLMHKVAVESVADLVRLAEMASKEISSEISSKSS